MSLHREHSNSLPLSWRRVAIKDMADSIQYGHTASAIQREDGPRFLRITDIQNNRVEWSDVPSCDIPEKDIPKYRLATGDLVFARTGATTGKSFLIRDCPEAVFASYLIRVRVSKDVDSRYLAAFFQSPDYWRQIEGGKRGIGQPNVNGQVLGEVQFPLAPLDEQHRIVAEIEKQFTRLDAGVAALLRVQANLKRYRTAVLKAAFEGKLVPTEAELAKTENRNFETGDELLTRILCVRRQNWMARRKYQEPATAEKAKLPQLSTGWTWATVEQVAAAIVDCPHSTPKWSECGRLCVRTTEFRPGLLDLTDVRFVNEKTYQERILRLEPRPGDILYSREGGILGVACRVPNGVSLCLGQRMMLIRSSEGVLSRFLMDWLNSPATLTRVKSLTSGSASPHLNVGEVRQFPIPLPPLSEQTRIMAEVERRLSVVEEVEAMVLANLQRASGLRQSILQKGFAGRFMEKE